MKRNTLKKLVPKKSKNGIQSQNSYDHSSAAHSKRKKKKKKKSQMSLTESESKKQERLSRFSTYNGKMLVKKDETRILQDNIIVGTCTSLEKKYLRLTSDVVSSQVRPLNILVQALPFVLNKYYTKQGTYAYLAEQLKSIRQDLTVQHIQNSFTTKIYKVHVRLALENKDLKEYTQCASKLFELIEKKDKDFDEFLGYHILYGLYLRNKYGQPSSELDSLLKRLYNYSKVFGKAQGAYWKGVLNLLDLLKGFVIYTGKLQIFGTFKPKIPVTFLQKRFPEETFGTTSEEYLYSAKELENCMENGFQWEVLKGDNVLHASSS
eukprot:snap_masked-scaffold_4-processed-gene-13.15-mRNA-1 protein AED:1.00 eAED:1.00 QI:0/0/0/0/1/1/2/0/320